MITTLVLQVCVITSGFIIPRLILGQFGSTVNGLVSSIIQFLSYITLVEGGLSGVIMASLYKPLVDKDNQKISSIIKTSSNFYKRVGFVFIIYTLIVGVVYPLIFGAGFSFVYVFALTIIMSFNLLIQYMFSLSARLFLTADKKIYIVSITQTIIVVANIVLAYVSLKIYPSIHVFKLVAGLLYILQPLVFNSYIKSHYKIDKSAKEDLGLIKNRWNGFAINVAAFIHNSTDITILTIFTNLTLVSVYSVYALVSAGLKTIIMSVTDSVVPTVGQAYASGDAADLNKKMDHYEFVIFILVFLFFSVAGLLITPFVQIYTSGISDANYYQPVFGVFLLLSEACYLIKSPHLNLAYSANKFKEITVPAFIEAGINIAVSLVLVNFYGLVGIAVGTLCAMIYRMIFHVYYTKKLVESRKQSIFYKKLLVYSLATVAGVAICVFLLPLTNITILNWLIYGVLYVTIMSVIYFLVSILFYKNEVKFFLKYLKK